MLPASSNFYAAELADVKQVASKVQLILGNYASAPGASASASGSDASGAYPANGAIDGDRTELNIGPASGADNDIGLSSWRSAVAPSVTPQTLTVDMNQSRKINRVKLYHLASHGLKSFKLESSPDNSTFTLIAKTTDQGGTISTTHQLDTVDFADTTCRYVKLTITDTVVASDKANVVELEIYRLLDITSRVFGVEVDFSRDFKVGSPLASTVSLSLWNDDRFFSRNYVPTAAEVAAGFVNSELNTNMGIIAYYGFAYGGATPEFVECFIGYVDRLNIQPSSKTATIEGRDGMKPLINQVVSSKLKTTIDISSCIQYSLNLCNISNWEMSLLSTGIIEDVFFINNQDILSTVRQLVEAAGDAVFYFDELGIATFKTFLGSTPQSHLESTTADFNAGTVLANIDTASLADQFGRKWFLLDDFADGNFNLNPIWTNRVPPNSLGDTTEADFEAATSLTNISTKQIPGSIQRNWILIDGFSDNEFSNNPTWVTTNGNYSSFPPFPTNNWSVSSQAMRYTPGGTQFEGRASTPFGQTTGTWMCQMAIADTANTGYIEFFFFVSSIFADQGPRGSLSGYCIRLSRGTGAGGSDESILYRVDSPGNRTILSTAFHSPFGSARYSYRVTRDALGTFQVWINDVLTHNPSTPDTTFSTSVAVGFMAQTASSTAQFTMDEVYYCYDVTDPSQTQQVILQAVFESRVFDQSSQVLAEGLFTADVTAPAGTSVSFFTATSTDNITYSAYTAVTNGGLIHSPARRYLKYKALLLCPADSGINANVTTPLVNSVSFQFTVRGWQCISNALKYLPGTSGLIAGIDLSDLSVTGTWRVGVTMQPGTASGMAFRMYPITTGYDIPTATYLSGYYAQVDQANSKLGIYKIDSSGTRTLLLDTTQSIDTSTHSLRFTRTTAGVLTLYWDEVQKVQVTDASFSAGNVLAFEVAPGADTNGFAQADDVYYSPVVDGTGAISTAQAVFESDVIDMSTSLLTLGVFQAGFQIFPGTALQFFTATSADGITFDAYVAVSSGSAIASTLKRYIKYKVILTCPIDNGTKGTSITPIVTDVTINWNIGTGVSKYPSTVSYVFQDQGVLMDMEEEYSDVLGGDTALYNDIQVQAQPFYLNGNDTDVKWQGTVQTPPVPISASAPLSVSNGQVLVYAVVLGDAMDISRMSGANPAALALSFGSGASASWVFTRIHPTQPIVQITITGSGTFTNLQIQGKGYSSNNSIALQTATDATSIKKNGDRALPISNPYIINSGIALSIAQRLLLNYKNPIDYVPNVTVQPIWAVQLGDRITVINDNTGISFDCIVSGLTKKLISQQDSLDAETTLQLLKVL